MSFCDDVKQALVNAPVESRACAVAELSAILYASSIIIEEDELTLVVSGRKHFTATRAICLANHIAQNDAQAERTSRAVWRGGEARNLLVTCGIISGDGWFASSDIERPKVTQGANEARAFLRGMFISAGLMANPSKEYHMEFTTADERLAEVWLEVVESQNLAPKQTRRKDTFVIYIKEAERIAECLAMMGAGFACCEVEDAIINGSLRSDANRAANCDSANTDKTINASYRQLEAIRALERSVGLSSLPDVLRDAAAKRLAYPELSLSELAALLTPRVSKSGANHRLARIMEIAGKGR